MYSQPSAVKARTTPAVTKQQPQLEYLEHICTLCGADLANNEAVDKAKCKACGHRVYHKACLNSFRPPGHKNVGYQCPRGKGANPFEEPPCKWMIAATCHMPRYKATKVSADTIVQQDQDKRPDQRGTDHESGGRSEAGDTGKATETAPLVLPDQMALRPLRKDDTDLDSMYTVRQPRAGRAAARGLAQASVQAAEDSDTPQDWEERCSLGSTTSMGSVFQQHAQSQGADATDLTASATKQPVGALGLHQLSGSALQTTTPLRKGGAAALGNDIDTPHATAADKAQLGMGLSMSNPQPVPHPTAPCMCDGGTAAVPNRSVSSGNMPKTVSPTATRDTRAQPTSILALPATAVSTPAPGTDRSTASTATAAVTGSGPLTLVSKGVKQSPQSPITPDTNYYPSVPTALDREVAATAGLASSSTGTAKAAKAAVVREVQKEAIPRAPPPGFTARSRGVTLAGWLGEPHASASNPAASNAALQPKEPLMGQADVAPEKAAHLHTSGTAAAPLPSTGHVVLHKVNKQVVPAATHTNSLQPGDKMAAVSLGTWHNAAPAANMVKKVEAMVPKASSVKCFDPYGFNGIFHSKFYAPAECPSNPSDDGWGGFVAPPQAQAAAGATVRKFTFDAECGIGAGMASSSTPKVISSTPRSISASPSVNAMEGGSVAAQGQNKPSRALCANDHPTARAIRPELVSTPKPLPSARSLYQVIQPNTTVAAPTVQAVAPATHHVPQLQASKAASAQAMGAPATNTPASAEGGGGGSSNTESQVDELMQLLLG